jgi:integrase
MAHLKYRALTDAAIRAAAPRPRLYRLHDGDGLTVTVLPSGKKTYHLRLQRGGADRVIRIGDAAKMTLAQARIEARRQRVRDEIEGDDGPQATRTFEQVFEEWHATKKTGWTVGHAHDCYQRVAVNALPEFGRRPIDSITRAEVLALLQRVATGKKGRPAPEQARRVRMLLHSLFEFAITAELRTKANPAPVSLTELLPKRKKGHYTAAPWAEMPKVMKAVAGYPSLITANALRFLVLAAARTSEVRNATWDEIDLKARLWRIPADRMKMKREHWVPLSPQAIEILKTTPRASASLIFPTLRADRPMSENTMLFAIKALGFDFTVHGFRAAFSTWAHEKKIAEHAVIELALAHEKEDDVAAAYDRSERIEDRRVLLAKWADFVEPKKR